MAEILVVDDSSFMRKKIAQAIGDAGHVVLGEAGDGAEGFELYKKLNPDVVVMDITMRGTDGITAAEMIREYDAGARIIFMSIISDPKVLAKARAAGAEAFIGKDEYDRLMSLI